MIRRPPRSPLFPNTTLSRFFVDVSRGLPAQLALGTERAGIGNPAAGVDAGVLLRMHRADILQPAIGGDHQFTGLRADLAGVAHAHAVFVAEDRKSTRLNSRHSQKSYAVFCLKKKKKKQEPA